EGRTQRYDVTINNDLTQTRRIVGADGLTTLSTAAGATFTVVKPDGTTISTTQTGDQRFGMLAPFGDSATARMPSGLTSTMKRTRTTTLANPLNALSLLTLTEKTTINGKTTTLLFDAATRAVTATSPFGRRVTSTLDAKARLTSIREASLMPITLTYDDRGRVITAAQGSRGRSMSYDAADRLVSVTDALGRTTSFAYDAA